MAPPPLQVNSELEIPATELRFETSRSSGPGGQHVNKTESKVTLVFDLERCAALSDEQRDRLRERLGARLSKQGELRLSSQSHRSQKANREEVLERFARLLRRALEPEIERKRTRPPAAAKRRRVDAKRRRSAKKALRKPPAIDS